MNSALTGSCVNAVCAETENGPDRPSRLVLAVIRLMNHTRDRTALVSHADKNRDLLQQRWKKTHSFNDKQTKEDGKGYTGFVASGLGEFRRAIEWIDPDDDLNHWDSMMQTRPGVE